MNKITYLFTVALMAASAFAGTVKMASEEWVKKLIAKELANYSEKPIQFPETIPEIKNEVIEYTGPLTLDNGETVQARIGFVPATNLVLIIRNSNCDCVTNGTTYVWNKDFGTWDTVQSTELPTIRYYKIGSDGTNSTCYYSATINGTNYHSFVWGSKTYLMPDGSTMQSGNHFEVSVECVSDLKYKAACGNDTTPISYNAPFSFSLFLSAYAKPEDLINEINSPDTIGKIGNISIGTLTYDKAGRTYTFFGDGEEFEFNIDGNNSTLRNYIIDSFFLWLDNMSTQVIRERGNLINDNALNAENWGLPQELTGTDGMKITRKNLVNSEFWKNAINEVVEDCQKKYFAYFQKLYEAFIYHDLPAAD